MLEGTRSSSPSYADGFRTRWCTLPTGAPRRRGIGQLLRLVVKLVCWSYLRAVHGYRFRYHPDLPIGRPYIVVISHTSLLDVPCLLAADPYDPPTSMVIKGEMIRLPFLGRVLRTWGAIPVDRRGQDIAALRQIRKTLAAGRGICVAPSGTRSADGRLGPINPVLVRLILQSDAPVVPCVIVGSYECLPRAAKFPRPGPIYLDSGPEIDLSRFRGRRLSPEDLVAAAAAIREGLTALLPASMQPLPETPILGSYSVGE